MGQTGAKQITLMIDEYLCLVFQPAESIGMNDTVPVALKLAPSDRRVFMDTTAT